MLAFQPSSAPEVAEALRVDARTARRLLNRLTDEGWLVRTDGRVRTYTLSLRLVALAAHFLERAPLTRAATTVVAALHEQHRRRGSRRRAELSLRAVPRSPRRRVRASGRMPES